MQKPNQKGPRAKQSFTSPSKEDENTLTMSNKCEGIRKQPAPINKDIAAYEAELPKACRETGKYAVFLEAKPVETFGRYGKTEKKAHEVALEPFLVEQVSAIPQVQHCSRALGFEPPTSF